MTDYFVPKAMQVTLPSTGRVLRLWRGLHALPRELADHGMANRLGIKPAGEMTDAEWKSIGMKKPPVAVPAPAPTPAVALPK